MNHKIKACFTEQVISQCAKYYNLSLSDLEILGCWQNFVYGYENGIIRITHHSHRSFRQIQEELDFILYLHNNGLSVSVPILSPNNKYIECVEQDDDKFYIVCFERAYGKTWIFTDESIYKIGEMTGLLHTLSRQYSKNVRHHWYNNGYLLEHKLYISDKYKMVIDNAAVLIEDIKKLPVTSYNYGLVHGDINGNNYLVDNNGEIKLFDFDECQLDWYADDIVIQLFYYTYVFEDVYERANYFLTHFMKGYRKYSDITKNDIEIMPLLFRMRELIVFTGACRGFNNNWDEYTQRFVNRLSLMNNPLYIDVNKLRF